MEKLLELPPGVALFLTVIAIPETFQSVFVFHLTILLKTLSFLIRTVLLKISRII